MTTLDVDSLSADAGPAFSERIKTETDAAHRETGAVAIRRRTSRR